MEVPDAPRAGASLRSILPPVAKGDLLRPMRAGAAVIFLFLSLFARVPPAGAVTALFARHELDPAVPGAWSVAAADLDGDGDVDLAGAANVSYHGGPPAEDRLLWWERGGDGTFSRHDLEASFPGAWIVRAADLDRDGDADVAACSYEADTIAWWENDGHGSFARHDVDTAFTGAVFVAVADLDGDGDLDLLGAAHTAGTIAWWENDGRQNFTRRDIDTGVSGAGGVAAADLDGDGDLDLAGVAYAGNAVYWWRNDGRQGFARRGVEAGLAGAGWIVAVDLDRDGDRDLLGTAVAANTVIWWENDGVGHFARHPISTDFEGAKAAIPIDVDGDGDRDVVAAAYGSDGTGGGVAWWENDGRQGYRRRDLDATFVGAKFMAEADLDGDGDCDVAVPSPHLDAVAWFENRQELAAGSFEGAGGVSAWKGAGLTAGDGPVAAVHRTGARSFRLTGGPAAKSIRQRLPLAGTAGERLVLSGWSRAAFPAPGDTPHRLELVLDYADGTRAVHDLVFPTAAGWAFRRGVFAAGRDFTGATVRVVSRRRGGMIWLDDLRLVVR